MKTEPRFYEVNKKSRDQKLAADVRIKCNPQAHAERIMKNLGKERGKSLLASLEKTTGDIFWKSANGYIKNKGKNNA
jgi:hypothetical protein